MGVAEPTGRDAGGEVIHRLVREAGDLHVEQRQIDVLTFAGPVARGERRLHRVGRVQPGQDVGQRDADFHRAAAGFNVGPPGQAHQAAEALDQEVVAGARRVRSVLAETGDRAIHEARIDDLQRCVVEAVAREPALLEVLQHDVALAGQIAQQLPAVRLRHVYRDRTLVAVRAQEICGNVGVVAVRVLEERRTPVAGVVALARTLDLDDVGAEVGKDLAGPRAGQNPRQVAPPDIRPGAPQGGAAAPPPARPPFSPGGRWAPCIGPPPGPARIRDRSSTRICDRAPDMGWISSRTPRCR